VWGLRVVFAAFAEDVGADVQGATVALKTTTKITLMPMAIY
jgi:hypothetical protein